MTTVSVRYVTARHPVTGRAITGYFITENGRITGYYAYQDRDTAVREARALAQIRTGQYVDTGAHGWPLVPSKAFLGELTLACPKCGSINVTLGTRYPVRGTGAGGRGRLGDPGATEYARCQTCGYEVSSPSGHVEVQS